MVIDDTAASIRPDCTAANRPLNGMFTNFTSMPSRLPTSVIRSISKPTILPLASWNSQGTLPILAPTFISSAWRESRREVASKRARNQHASQECLLFIPFPFFDHFAHDC